MFVTAVGSPVGGPAQESLRLFLGLAGLFDVLGLFAALDLSPLFGAPGLYLSFAATLGFSTAAGFFRRRKAGNLIAKGVALIFAIGGGARIFGLAIGPGGLFWCNRLGGRLNGTGAAGDLGGATTDGPLLLSAFLTTVPSGPLIVH